MQRAVTFLLILVTCFYVGRLSQQLPVNAQDKDDNRCCQEDTPPCCQDVNGAGGADLSDAVYLLTWLFLGGAEPTCPCLPPPPATCSLPSTGQTVCYDGMGTEIDCASDTCPGQDAFHKAGCADEDRFVDADVL